VKYHLVRALSDLRELRPRKRVWGEVSGTKRAARLEPAEVDPSAEMAFVGLELESFELEQEVVPKRRERTFTRGTDPQISTKHDHHRSASAGRESLSGTSGVR
jgi:hypothetical protein